MNTLGKLSLLSTTLGIIANQKNDVTRLIYEAHRLGIRVITYTRSNNLTMRNADVVIIGQMNDKAKLRKFATNCQIVMYMNGSGVNTALINYLQRFTRVPQGTKSLDLINDLSIQRVFLNMIHVKSLPYDTIFSSNDVSQILNKLGEPVLLRPVHTDFLQSRDVIITNSRQLSAHKSIFNGEAYLVESLPKRARYFKLTVAKSRTEVKGLPALETDYKGQQLDSVSVNSGSTLNQNNRLNLIATQIANHINYVGLLTISFILTNNNQIYVDGINTSFNLVNNIYNLTPNNVYQTFLRVMLGLPIQTAKGRYSWTMKLVNRNNLDQLEKLWINNSDAKLDLSPLVNKTGQNGYMLMSTTARK